MRASSRRDTMKKTLLLCAIIFSMVISGCATENGGTQQTGTQPASPPSAGESELAKNVDISGFAFSPGTITIQKGTRVVWTNKDAAPHSVISDTGNELASDAVSQGGSYAHTFNEPGTHEYHCGVHPSMKGKVIVE
ncbi:TPA: cupredoxin family copper-binding protein [Candidatus Woesearchaeota archaeon]|nr:cupredoxin family copper-binding protein [Candidatus Woesearchaeota archaeon]